MRVAREVLLSEDERKSLERRARARICSARSVERARIVLLASSGLQDQQIAAQLKITPEKALAGGTGFSTAVWKHWRRMHRDPAEHRPSQPPGCSK